MLDAGLRARQKAKWIRYCNPWLSSFGRRACHFSWSPFFLGDQFLKLESRVFTLDWPVVLKTYSVSVFCHETDESTFKSGILMPDWWLLDLFMPKHNSVKLKQVLLGMAFAVRSKNDTFTWKMRISFLKWLLAECFGAGEKYIHSSEWYRKGLSGLLHNPLVNLKLALLDVENRFHWVSVVWTVKSNIVFYCAISGLWSV